MARGPAYQEVPLRVSYSQWERQEGDCATEGSQNCVTVRLRSPEAQGGAPALRESLSAYVHSYMLQAFHGLMPDRPARTSLDSVISAFFSDYHRQRAMFPEAALPWGVEIEGEVVHISEEVVTLRMIHREALGDTSPNQWTRYAMFDRGTGRTLTLEDLTKDTGRVTQVAETYFRRYHHLAPEADLRAAGFTFPAGRFRLTDNLGLTHTGLVIHYDAYEIAPPDLGPTTLIIPPQALGGLLLY